MRSLDRPTTSCGPRTGADPLVVTDTEVRAKLAGLVGGILAAVGLMLGVQFTIAGLLGGPPPFRVAGPIAAAFGLFAGVAGWAGARRGRRRAIAEAAARTRRAAALVRVCDVNTFSRVGTRNPVDIELEVEGVAVRRTIYANPGVTLAPGERLAVMVDPNRPDNFVPLHL